MEIIWTEIEEWYKLMHSWKTKKAENIFLEIYYSYKNKKIEAWNDYSWKIVSCILGLWELSMKKWNMKESLFYYLEWNELTNWKDFNILFNLWVVYWNLWEKEKSQIFIDKALKINPKDENLLRFIWESLDNKDNNNELNDGENNQNNNDRNNERNNRQNGEKMEKSFIEKINSMLKEIKK